MKSLIRIFAFTLSCTAAAQADPWVHIDKIVAGDLGGGASNVKFASAIGADVRFGPDTVRAIYVGVPNATVVDNGNTRIGAGEVYVFTQTGGSWRVSSKFHATGAQAQAHFGAAIAVHNGVIVVGEPDYDAQGHTDSGRAWIYEDYFSSSNTVIEPVISSVKDLINTFDNAHFGASVAVDGSGRGDGTGTWVAVGAPGAVGAGCAYVKYLNGAMQVTDYSNVCGASSGIAFGASVAVLSLGAAQLKLLVGAPAETQGTADLAGAVHTYIIANGILTAFGDLHAQNPAFLDVFGTSLAIDTQRIYVGATGRVKSGVGRTGSVSLFEPANIVGYDFAGEVFPNTGAAAGDLCGASLYLNQATERGFAMGCPGGEGLVNGEGEVRAVTPIPFLGGTLWLDTLLSMGDLPHGADDMGRDVVIVGDHVYAAAPEANDGVGPHNGVIQVFATDALFEDGFQ